MARLGSGEGTLHGVGSPVGVRLHRVFECLAS